MVGDPTARRARRVGAGLAALSLSVLAACGAHGSGSPTAGFVEQDPDGKHGAAVEQGAKLASGGYEVGHGTQIVAVDDQDRSPIGWTEGTAPQLLAEDLAGMLEQPQERSS